MWKKETVSGWSIKDWLKKPGIPGKIVYGGLAAAAFTLWFLAFLFWMRSGDWEQKSGLYYEEEVISGARIDGYVNGLKARDEAGPAGLTVWKSLKNQQIESKSMGRRVMGEAVLVCGKIEDVLPYRLLAGGYGFSEDESGCVLSRQAAIGLFGATDVLGLSVEFGGRAYNIRGVLDSPKVFLAVHEKKDVPMTYIEILGEEDSHSAKSIIASLGLSDAEYVSDGSFYHSLLRLSVTLPLWVLYVRLLFFYKERKIGLTTKLRILSSVILWILLGGGLLLSFSFGADFIPSRWSDFAFWSKKIQDVLANERAGGAYQQLCSQVLIWKNLEGGIWCSLLSAFCLWTVLWRNSKKNG